MISGRNVGMPVVPSAAAASFSCREWVEPHTKILVSHWDYANFLMTAQSSALVSPNFANFGSPSRNACGERSSRTSLTNSDEHYTFDIKRFSVQSKLEISMTPIKILVAGYEGLEVPLHLVLANFL